MFRFSDYSLNELEDVHPDLVRLVERALELTTVDFVVWDGMRTKAEQEEYVKTGASKTMDSRHLFGLAVDLVPFVGKPRWEWPLCYQVAEAVRAAANELGQPVVWGGMWARLDGTVDRPEVLRARYSGWDGPHFELPRDAYPNNWRELAEIEEKAYQEQLAAQAAEEAAEEARLKAEEERRAQLGQEEELRRLEAEKLAQAPQEVYVPQPDLIVATGETASLPVDNAVEAGENPTGTSEQELPAPDVPAAADGEVDRSLDPLPNDDT